jgi:hypothetical protein
MAELPAAVAGGQLEAGVEGIRQLEAGDGFQQSGSGGVGGADMVLEYLVLFALLNTLGFRV